MFGIEQIKTMNAEPEEHTLSEMSDGQERREKSQGAYWSEQPEQSYHTQSDEIEFKGHDGPGYSRGMYTGLTRRGNPITPMSTAADHGRMVDQLPNSETGVDVWGPPAIGGELPAQTGANPIPGTEWETPYIPTVEEQLKTPPKPTQLPDVYFDAVKVKNTLEQMRKELTADIDRIEWLMRQIIASPNFTGHIVRVAAEIVREISNDPTVRIRMKIEELANMLEAAKR